MTHPFSMETLQLFRSLMAQTNISAMDPEIEARAASLAKARMELETEMQELAERE